MQPVFEDARLKTVLEKVEQGSRLDFDDGVTLHLSAKAPGDQLATQPIDLALRDEHFPAIDGEVRRAAGPEDVRGRPTGLAGPDRFP